MAAPSINILPCFENIINIRGLCENEDSLSGYYANDIDITKDFIDQIRTREYSSALDFHERKLAFAIKLVVDEVLTFMQSQFRTPTLLSNYRVGQHQDNLTLIAGDGNYKGINIDLWNCNSYLDVFIEEISLQLSTTQNVAVKIYDLIQNKLLETVTVACVANEISSAYPQLTFKSGRQKLNLAFLYDSTGLSSNTTYLKNGGTCASCSGGSLDNPYQRISAVKIPAASQKIKGNLTNIGETGGLSIVHSLSCNHESWLCSFSNLMAPAILFKYGVLVMEFAQLVAVNDRVNTTLDINAEELDARRLSNLGKYGSAMKKVLNNIKTPSDKECFTCKSTVHHAIMI